MPRSAVQALLLAHLLIACEPPPFIELPDRPTLAPPPVWTTTIAEAILPASPQPPAPLSEAPCAPGWVRSKEGPLCVPYPEGRPDCPIGQGHSPGAPFCAPLGQACPEGDFSLPQGSLPRYYVRPGASGSGSEAAPFGSINEALSALRGGPPPYSSLVLMLSKGDFVESILVPDGVHLQGACAEQTRIVPTSGEYAVLMRGQSSMRDLSVRSPEYGVVIGLGAAALEGVHIFGARGLGIAITETGRLDARGLRISDITDPPSRLGWAFEVSGQLHLERGLIERAAIGVSAFEGSQLRLEDLAAVDLRDTGLLMREGQVTLERALVEVVHDRPADGIVFFGAQQDAALEVRESYVRGSGSDQRAAVAAVGPLARLSASRSTFVDGFFGVDLFEEAQGELSELMILGGQYGVNANEGAQLVAQRLFIQGAKEVGFNLDGERTFADVQDLFIQEAGEADDRIGGLGLFRGAAMRLQRARLEKSRPRGITVQGRSQRPIQLEDVLVSRSYSEGDDGEGVLVAGELRLELSRARFEQNAGQGLLIIEQMGFVDLHAMDLWAGETQQSAAPIDETPPGLDGRGGNGLVMFGGALTLERARFSNNVEISVYLQGGQVEVSDLIIEGTLPDSRGQFGRGLALFDVVGSMRRVRLQENREVALSAFGEGTELSLEDLRVEQTRASRCDPLICERELDPAGGVGVASIGAQVRIERFELRGNALCGVEVAEGGGLDLKEGLIAEHLVGACLLSEGFDVDRLNQDVRYEDNEAKLSAAPGLYVPKVIAPQLGPGP